MNTTADCKIVRASRAVVTVDSKVVVKVVDTEEAVTVASRVVAVAVNKKHLTAIHRQKMTSLSKLKNWDELDLILDGGNRPVTSFWSEVAEMKQCLQDYLGTDLPEPATAAIVEDYHKATAWLGYARVAKGRASSYLVRAKGLATRRAADENPDLGTLLIKDLVNMYIWRFVQEANDWHNIVKGLQERVWSGRNTSKGDNFERGSQSNTEM